MPTKKKPLPALGDQRYPGAREDVVKYPDGRAMTPAELTAAVKEIADRGGRDPEADHSEIDALFETTLERLGYEDAVEIAENVVRWYA